MKSIIGQLSLLGVLVGTLSFFCGIEAKGQVAPGTEWVRTSLVADVTSIEPGLKFRVGVLYQLEPKSHIYWKYSRDAGLPTKIDWQLPPGFKVGALQWPLPNREKEPGGLEVFDYSQEVLLFTDVQAPQDLPPGQLELRARSEWLVCQSSCVPGQADLSATVQVGTSTPSPQAALFDRYAKTVPSALPDKYKISFTRSAKSLDLRVIGVTQGVAVDFYPVPSEGSRIGHAAVTDQRVTIPIDTDPEQIKRLDGVLVIGDGESRRGYEINSSTPLSSESAPSPVAQSASGLWQALLFAVIGGLILNVMPCVLPVISLKVFGFVSEAGERPAKVFRLSLAFAAGILSCFALLAIVVILLRAAGAQVGWGFQFQDFRFVFLIACLVFAFALNLFGVFEIAVSAKATGGLARIARGQGYGSAFFQGVFATVLATPCTAPFLGTASAFAFAQPSWITFLVFIFVGIGMALPYLVLAVNPTWIRFLPKPGSWMLRFKQALGFLLLATLLWLVWIAGQLKGVDGIVTLGGWLLAISILAWIKGSFWMPVSPLRARWLSAAAMVLVILGAVSCYAFVTTASQVAWEEFSQASLEKALSSGQPVFIDFTADWCLTCKWNERFAIDTPAVRNAFVQRKVIVLKADWTHEDSVITQILKEHGRAGVPMYLYYPGGKERQPVVLPEVITSPMVLDVLNKA